MSAADPITAKWTPRLLDMLVGFVNATEPRVPMTDWCVYLPLPLSLLTVSISFFLFLFSLSLSFLFLIYTHSLCPHYMHSRRYRVDNAAKWGFQARATVGDLFSLALLKR